MGQLGQTIEDVLLNSIGRVVQLCVNCSSSDVARKLAGQIGSGACVYDINVDGVCLACSIKLDMPGRAQTYAQDLVRLCASNRPGLKQATLIVSEEDRLELLAA